MANLKNYTSTIDSLTSISRIERRLCDMGAQRVMKDYDRENKIFSALYFELEVRGNYVCFRLPARIEACFKVINRNRKRDTEEGRKKDWAQAERTAWKTLYDWVDVQMAMIEMEQAQLAEIFLPYAYDRQSNQTLYEKAVEKGFNQLLLN